MSGNVSSGPVDHYTVDHFLGRQISWVHRGKMDFVPSNGEPLSHLMDCALGTACKGMPDVPVVEPEDAHATAIAPQV